MEGLSGLRHASVLAANQVQPASDATAFCQGNDRQIGVPEMKECHAGHEAQSQARQNQPSHSRQVVDLQCRWHGLQFELAGEALADTAALAQMNRSEEHTSELQSRENL